MVTFEQIKWTDIVAESEVDIIGIFKHLQKGLSWKIEPNRPLAGFQL